MQVPWEEKFPEEGAFQSFSEDRCLVTCHHQQWPHCRELRKESGKRRRLWVILEEKGRHGALLRSATDSTRIH